MSVSMAEACACLPRECVEPAMASNVCVARFEESHTPIRDHGAWATEAAGPGGIVAPEPASCSTA
eukprot:4559903-Lingulodinium_polyedra.AAC.1